MCNEIQFCSLQVQQEVQECFKQIRENYYYNLDPRLSVNIIHITVHKIHHMAYRTLNLCNNILSQGNNDIRVQLCKKQAMLDLRIGDFFLSLNRNNRLVKHISIFLNKIDFLNQKLWNYRNEPIPFFLPEMSNFIEDFNKTLFKYINYQIDSTKFAEINAFIKRSFACLENVRERSLNTNDINKQECYKSDYNKAKRYLAGIQNYFDQILQFWHQENNYILQLWHQENNYILQLWRQENNHNNQT